MVFGFIVGFRFLTTASPSPRHDGESHGLIFICCMVTASTIVLHTLSHGRAFRALGKSFAMSDLNVYRSLPTINQPTNQSINHSINQSINQSIHQSINPSLFFVCARTQYDEWVCITSGRLAPPGTKTYQEGGRLCVGHRVEAMDDTGEVRSFLFL